MKGILFSAGQVSMSTLIRKTRINLLIAISISFISMLSTYGSVRAQDSTLILEWLTSGTVPLIKPAFSDMPNISGKAYEKAELFKNLSVEMERTWPQAGDSFPWPDLSNIAWKTVKAARDGFVEIPIAGDAKSATLAALCLTYLKADRFVKISITIRSNQPIQVLHNGKECCQALKRQKDEDFFLAMANIVMEPGSHHLLLKGLYTNEPVDAPWRFQVHYSIQKGAETSVKQTLSPMRLKDRHYLLEGQRINAVIPSYNGDYFILQMEETQAVTGEREEWPEIWKTSDLQRKMTFRGTGFRNMSWSPAGNQIMYRTREKDKAVVWIMDLMHPSTKRVLAEKDLEMVRWSVDGKSLLYSVGESVDDKSEGVRRVLDMPDKWNKTKRRSYLYRLDLKTLHSQRLTWGPATTTLLDVHPDGHSLLIATSKPDFSKRPFTTQTLMTLDIASLRTDTLFTTDFSVNATYSPDGRKLLLSGSPMLFGGIGSRLSGQGIPNDYDTQLYIYDLESKEAKSISLNFDPAVQQAIWSRFDQRIYLLATDKTFKRLYTYDPKNDRYSLIDTEPEVISQFQVAMQGPWLGYTGSSKTVPPIGYLHNLRTGKKQIVSHPEVDVLAQIELGQTREWNFKKPDGQIIEGLVYLPPGFDERERYPVIVHYYGGTSPVDRSFRGRYPKNYFAAHGYIIYVLQPSGASGYGQEFSAQHVNNWGQTVADEIIMATRQFLRDHSYTDSTRVACIGASYGGFMTMLILSQTDLFRAGIAHAGISSISSYWGEGRWGYLYSSAASANSFPWNNQELYVGQSPLFRADKITTPLLLLHGQDDDNVPPGESMQLFTALKILGRPVELVEIEGQGHHILDYHKRIKWQRTIMAWLAKQLQDDPSWWDEMYPSQ